MTDWKAQLETMDFYPEPSHEEWKEADRILQENGLQGIDRFFVSAQRKIVEMIVEEQDDS